MGRGWAGRDFQDLQLRKKRGVCLAVASGNDIREMHMRERRISWRSFVKGFNELFARNVGLMLPINYCCGVVFVVAVVTYLLFNPQLRPDRAYKYCKSFLALMIISHFLLSHI